MFLVSSCSCLRSIHWSHVLSWEWRCSWSSADRRCSNYIWVINKFIAYKGATYIRGFTVVSISSGNARLSAASHYLSHNSDYRISNALWPSDAIWWHRSGSTFGSDNVLLLTAASHYMNKYWPIISDVFHWGPAITNSHNNRQPAWRTPISVRKDIRSSSKY